MTENKGSLLLKISLIIFALIDLLYGVTYMFVPQFHVQLSGDAIPVASGWLRWFGPILIALGIGALMVLQKLEKQGSFVKMAGIGTFLCGQIIRFNSHFTKIPVAFANNLAFLVAVPLTVIQELLHVQIILSCNLRAFLSYFGGFR